MFKSIKDQTDEVLLVKLKRGNIRSFEAIYDRYAPMVLNFVRKISRIRCVRKILPRTYSCGFMSHGTAWILSSR